MNISVVIPAYNAENTIEETLNALLPQSSGMLEVIVVDNDSKDRTVEKVGALIRDNASLKGILVDQVEKGPSAARNRGAQCARGDIIAFLDADCIPPPNWIAVIKEEFAHGVNVAGGPYREYDTGTFLKSYLNIMEKAVLGAREVLDADVHNGRFIFGGNFAIKKDLFFRVGAFDEGMCLGEDVDLSKRIYASGNTIAYSPDMSVAHHHSETFKRRFKKVFAYGLLQAKFLKKHFCRGLTVVFSDRRRLSFTFPVKASVQFFSVLNPLLLAFAVSYVNIYIAELLLIALILGICVKVSKSIVKSHEQISVPMRLSIFLYWGLERALYDLGRIYGSLKYRVLCI